MKLSIITVNYRSWGHLEAALRALQADFPADWEIIVVDNESDSVALGNFSARFPWVTFVANSSNSGFAFACNLGAAKATGEQLLFMNPDVVAKKESLQKLLQIKEDHDDIAIAAPKQVSVAGKPQKVFDDFPSLLNQSKSLKALLRILLPSRFPNPRARYDSLVYCDWVTGSMFLISRNDFNAVGGWSEDYWMYVEDADLCRKAHDLGMRVAYVPEVQVIHAHGGSSSFNIDIKSMTKLEVIISKHVYTQRRTSGAERWLTHCLIPLLRLPTLSLAMILDILTLWRVPVLRVRSKTLVGLARYYFGVLRNRNWLSPRALANQSERA
ncbi:MAG: glycosyltransferase family 2 protein [Proteobacteria bacterium]|nr:glycosyltransferase family 2 protein [Pseudomonadota bacterium]MCH8099676.1 glycosyltransferase family 2 protein [Pseudomonadota bacterium]